MMERDMSCKDYNEPLNALLDGELPPDQAAALTAHLAACPVCIQTLAELAALRAWLAQALPEKAPVELQSRIESLLASDGADVIAFTPKPRAWLSNRPGWIAATALAAALMLTFLPHHDVTKDLMSVRDAALRSGPAVYAATTPPLNVPGFALSSSRNDVVAGHLAVVAVYIRGGQTITLCSWPADGEPAHGLKHAQYRGMTIDYWNDGQNEYWAASSSPSTDMPGFVAAVAAAS
jgi:anti-sigma factor (TIGR02949 family)